MPSCARNGHLEVHRDTSRCPQAALSQRSFDGWKVLEHAFNFFSELLNVLVCVRGQGRAIFAAPGQLLAMAVENVDHEITDLRVLGGRRREAIPAEPPPSPAATKAVIERLECLLIVGATESADRCVSVGIDLRPSLRCELGIRILCDSVIPE